MPGLYAAGEVAGRNAWRQPARGQLAVGPAGVRPPGGSQRRVRRRPDAYASVGVRRRRARRSRRSTGTLAEEGVRTPTPFSTTSRRSCTLWSESSAQADEMEQALKEIAGLRERAAKVTVEGHRQYNPGWHLALDLHSMLRVSECIARAALERTESRGPHPRRFPATDDVGNGQPALPPPRRGSVGRQGATPGHARRLTRPVRGEVDELRPDHAGMAGTPPAATWPTTRSRSRRRGRPRRHTACRRHRPATWRCVGTARRASAGRVAPRSTAAPG